MLCGACSVDLLQPVFNYRRSAKGLRIHLNSRGECSIVIAVDTFREMYNKIAGVGLTVLVAVLSF